jgi:hypothetical protein
MDDQRDLERRVKELEDQIAVMRRAGRRNLRKRSSSTILGLPAYDVAIGPDPFSGELRGHARGFLAVGDIATGVIAVGGLARGVVAFGGVALGLIGFGGLSLALGLAIGGLAVGGVALGGGAAGGVAIGGGAAGVYAVGGAAAGTHVISPARRDPEAEAFFARFGVRLPTPQRRR